MKTFFIFPVFVFFQLCFVQNASAQNGQVFAAVKKGNHWGYIDTLGKLQIPFTLEKTGSFSEGLANVKYGKRWGYIDKKGNLKLKPIFIYANPFHDGRALVSFYDPKDSATYVGYINKSAFVVTLLDIYEKGFNYNDGYARIRSRSKTGQRYGYKDTLDSFKIKPKYEDAGDFYEGKATIESGNKWGFINQKNDTLVKPGYDDAYHFQEGLAYVSLGKSAGFINAKGETVFMGNYDDLDVLAQDGMICYRNNGKIGFMNLKGDTVIKPAFSGKTLTRFKDGLAPVHGDNGKYGYIDKKGNFVIQPQFDDANLFFNHYAVVKQNGKYGFIDKSGNWTIKPEYDEAYEFEPADFY